MSTELYDLPLHEGIQIERNLEVLRVPGGWLYITLEYSSSGNEWLSTTSTFVPYHNEFDDG